MLNKLLKLADEPEITVSAIKEMAIALDKIKNIKGIKSELDIQEQKARIKKLEKEVKGSEEIDNNSYGVVKMPNVVPLVPPPIEVNDNE